VAYCESDVHLLKEGCLNFKRLFEAKPGFNPFEHMNIASACNGDLRTNRMIPGSLASEPLGRWQNRINESQVALEWLTWRVHKLRQQALEQLTHENLEAHDLMERANPDHPHPTQCHYIQHVGNAGEFHVPGTPFTVDGFHRETNTVYESHGCFWHGCPKCYPVRDEKHLRLSKCNMHAVYEKTQNKMTHLRVQGYNVIEMWECQWIRLK